MEIKFRALSPCVILSHSDLKGHRHLVDVFTSTLALKKELWEYGKVINNPYVLSEDTPLLDLKRLLTIKAKDIVNAKAKAVVGYRLMPAIATQYIASTMAYLVRYKGSWDSVSKHNMFKHVMYPENTFRLIRNKEEKVYNLRLAKLKDSTFELSFKYLDEDLFKGKPKKLYVFKKLPTAFYYCYILFEPRAHRYTKKPPKKIVGLDLSSAGYVDHLGKVHSIIEKCFERVPYANKQYHYINFVAKEARRLTKGYRIICMENATGPVIGNWKQFQTAIRAHAVNIPQCILITESPAYTSQMCCICETIEKVAEESSIKHCGYCGSVMNRDKNAAVNILRKGLAKTNKMPLWLLKKRSKAKVIKVSPLEQPYLRIPQSMRSLPKDSNFMKTLDARLTGHPHKGIIGCTLTEDGYFLSSSDKPGLTLYITERCLASVGYLKTLREELVHNYSLIFVALPIIDIYGIGWEVFFKSLERRVIETNARLFYIHSTGTTVPCLYCDSKIINNTCGVCGYKINLQDYPKWILREGLRILKKDMRLDKGNYKTYTWRPQEYEDNYPFWWDLWGGR
jgi:hypothetical protein